MIGDRLRWVPLWALASVATGCISRSPGPEDFLSAGHRTAEQTLDTFRDALAADLPDLEFLCLSSAFRHRLGVTRLTYGEARDRVPFYRQLADAELVETEVIAPDRLRVLACIDHPFGEEWFRLELVREDYWELWSEDELILDGLMPFEDIVRIEGRRVVAEVNLEEDLTDIATELRVGRDWKIDGYEPVEAPPPL